MNKITLKLLLLVFITSFSPDAFSQTNPDDYWLNNGFSNGETVYTNSGFFYDDGGDSLYHPDQNWSVEFCSENGNPITLDFNSFRTYYNGGSYSNWDYMSINYPGTSLVAYDFDTPQFSFTSPNGCMTLGFHSKPEGMTELDSGWVAEISANPPPVNNDQCSATELVVGNVCSPSFYSNKGAWDTRGLGSPSCHQKFYGGDIWFSALVPDSGKLKIETIPGSLRYGIMVLYTGSCESLTEFECVDIPGTMPSRTFTGLNPGETVYIRIFGDQAKSGTFGICATDPTAEITGFTGPGGVGDSISNKLWLKADSGVTDINMNPLADGNNAVYWLDKSGNNYHMKQFNSPDQPVFNSSGLNSQPSLAFDGTQKYLTDTMGVFTAPINIYTVQEFSISKDQTVLALGDETETNTLSIGREDISNNYYTYTNGKQYGEALPPDPHILYATHMVNSPFHKYRLNGNSQTVNYTGGQVTTNGALYIGTDKDLNNYLDGRISEVIFYSKVLNTAQEIIVTNYLGAKYNISIAEDYFDFNTTHPYDLAGIGRVNSANIHSKAQSAGVLAIGGASDLGDNEFVLFAHDGKDIVSWISEEIPSSDPDVLRLEREWVVDITGDGPGSLSISIDTTGLPSLPESYIAYNILVDEDGDFSEGAAFYGLIPSDGEITANNIVLEDSSYIAIAAVKARLSFSSASSSGLESVERPVINVEMNYSVSVPVSVAYSVTSGTADETADYSLNDDVLVFEPGEKIKEIIPLIFEDTIVEQPDEWFNIHLADPGSGVLPGDTMDHIYTIVDNDISLIVSASDSTIGECSSSVTVLSADARGQGTISYEWSPAEGLTEPYSAVTGANPVSSTTYTITVTDSLGGSLMDSIRIIVDPLPPKPVITISGDNEICEGNSVELSTTGGYNYSWNTGESSSSISVDTTGNYTVILIDEYGCESISSDTVNISVYPVPDKPTININGDLGLCEGETVELTAEPGGYAYEWSSGQTTQSINVSEAGNYSVVAISANSCVSSPSDEITVTVDSKPEKPSVSYSGNTALCEGESIELSAPEGFSYLWSNGETSQSIVVAEENRYSVTILNGGCESIPSDSVEINVFPVPGKPEITPSGTIDILSGETVTLSSSEADEYMWSTYETTREIEVGTEGEYTVQVFNSDGCKSELSEPVFVNISQTLPAPDITVEGETAFCEGGSVTLTGEEAYAYHWSNGETTREITVSESGSFTLVIENENGVESTVSEPVIVEVLDNPGAEASVADVSCYDGSDGQIELTIFNGELPYAIEWDNGMTGPNIDGLSSGNYTATITDSNGCRSSINVGVGEASEMVIEGNITDSRCPDAASGRIELNVSGGNSPYSYSWDEGEGDAVLDNLSAGNYSVTVTDASNCSRVKGFEVSNHEETCLKIPDIITPNGDGKNDSWEIPGLELYPGVTVEIFDRWGKRVFYSKGYDENFDGTYNGKELPMESYHYVINLNNGTPLIIGNITIIR